MRIVHISDLHLGKTLFEISLINDQRYWLFELSNLLKKRNADVLVVSGDIYQRSVPPIEAVSLLDDFLSEVIQKSHIPVLIISGNHDSGERLAFASRLIENSGLYIASTLQKKLKTVTLPDAFGEVNFVMLPYFEPYEIKKLYEDDSIKTMNDAFKHIAAENFLDIDLTKRNVLIAHGFFGCDAALARFSDSERSVGGSDMIDCTLIKGFDYAALGHLHAPQTAGAQHIRYAGSPLKYSVSEASQNKCVTVIDLNAKGNVDIFCESLPPVHDLRIITGSLEDLADERYDNLNKSDYVYAVITNKGEVYGAMEKLRVVYPNIIGLRKATDDNEMLDVFSAGGEVKKKTIGALFGEFYRDMLGEELSPERAKLMAEVLKAAEREEHDL